MQLHYVGQSLILTYDVEKFHKKKFLSFYFLELVDRKIRFCTAWLSFV